MDEDMYRLVKFLFSKGRNKFLLIHLSNRMKKSITKN